MKTGRDREREEGRKERERRYQVLSFRAKYVVVHTSISVLSLDFSVVIVEWLKVVVYFKRLTN